MGATVTDTRYLEQHHGSWRVVVGWRVNGRVVKARRSLGTNSLKEAQRRRWAVVAELKVSTDPKPTTPHSAAPAESSARASATAWRAALDASTGEDRDPTQAALSDHLDRLPPAEARELAAQVYQTPLDLHLSAFITSRGNVGVDTRVRHERAVRDLTRWLPTPHTVEAVTRKLAIQYTDQLPPGRQDPQRLSLYWQWMVSREHATSDPWDGLQAIQRRPVEPERPWTDAGWRGTVAHL
jgi:hypothetical protein